jgi:hypothetical protein
MSDRHAFLRITELEVAEVGTVVEAFIREGLEAGVSTFEIRLPEPTSRRHQQAIADGALRALLGKHPCRLRPLAHIPSSGRKS